MVRRCDKAEALRVKEHTMVLVGALGNEVMAAVCRHETTPGYEFGE